MPKMSYNLNDSQRLENFTKMRRIKTTQSTDRGILYTTKSRIDGFVEYKSLTEEGLFLLLDHDPNCNDFESQPAKIPNKAKKGAYYVPDVWAKFTDGRQFLFDVKHATYFEKLARDPKEAEWWNNRVKTVRKYCDKNGLGYEIFTDVERIGSC